MSFIGRDASFIGRAPNSVKSILFLSLGPGNISTLTEPDSFDLDSFLGIKKRPVIIDSTQTNASVSQLVTSVTMSQRKGSGDVIEGSGEEPGDVIKGSSDVIEGSGDVIGNLVEDKNSNQEVDSSNKMEDNVIDTPCQVPPPCQADSSDMKSDMGSAQGFRNESGGKGSDGALMDADTCTPSNARPLSPSRVPTNNTFTINPSEAMELCVGGDVAVSNEGGSLVGVANTVKPKVSGSLKKPSAHVSLTSVSTG